MALRRRDCNKANDSHTNGLSIRGNGSAGMHPINVTAFFIVALSADDSGIGCHTTPLSLCFACPLAHLCEPSDIGSGAKA